ncbi:MAG: LutB/LldF family L-lactate oxidation iron-sulfur protein [Alphaproteobacteria bacterium]
MYQPTSHSFPKNSRAALADADLRRAMRSGGANFQQKRQRAIDALPEFDALRDRGRNIKDHVLEYLDYYLETYEAKVIATGGQVHWARDAEEARQHVLRICRSVDARTVNKGKTMIAEEIDLNDFLEQQGIVPVETDLGEYIIQLRKERPSHIIAPAIHLTKDQVADTFRKTHDDLDPARPLDDPRALLAEARQVLRAKFFEADVGITGANFLIAETGSNIIVTNEGNGDLSQLLPRVHIVLASLEKVVPTLEDATTLLRLLARSATGQELSVYTTLSTGPRRPGDLDGPEQYHVILLDNGRTKMLGTEFQEMLRCIRCGACMNHCPVYQAVGGHSYGWVYVGPMGAVLTPQFVGIEEAGHLPDASTFCGRCESVCPVHIPLPKLMRKWRERAFAEGRVARPFRLGLAVWAYVAQRPALYQAVTGLQMRLLGALGHRRGRFKRLPMAKGWTGYRDLPAPQGKTFQQLWTARRGAR